MHRERALKVVLVGLLATTAIYPATQILWYRDQPKYETPMGSTNVVAQDLATRQYDRKQRGLQQSRVDYGRSEGVTRVF